MEQKLGFYLKERRIELGIYSKEASKIIGVSYVHYSHMENDKVYHYDVKTLHRVANFLNQPVKWVLEKIPTKE